MSGGNLVINPLAVLKTFGRYDSLRPEFLLHEDRQLGGNLTTNDVKFTFLINLMS